METKVLKVITRKSNGLQNVFDLPMLQGERPGAWVY